MITSMIGGQFVNVQSPSGTYYNNSSMPMAGMLRYHSGGRVEVYDGNSWQTVSSTSQINLSPDAVLALEWAIKKRAEEQSLEQLCKDNPAVKAAYDLMKRAEDQLKTTIILSKDEETTS